MRIGDSIPLHIAKAYGLPQSKPLTQATGVHPPTIARLTPTDSFESEQPNKVSQLIAGRVARGVDFNSSLPTTPSTADSYPLYTRAADKIEAVTGVQLGRSLDITG